MENTSLIVTFAIILIVSYARAECKAKFTAVKEESKELPVTSSYLESRSSGWERFKNIMKRRLVDPICTSNQAVLDAVCECVTKKKSSKEKKNEKEETKESCVWTVISKPNGTSTLKYANLYSCGEVYVTQGYAAYDGNVHDVFVVEEKKGDAEGVSSFIFKGVARGMDFEVFKEDNNSFWSQLYLQGLSFILNWDKHY